MRNWNTFISKTSKLKTSEFEDSYMEDFKVKDFEIKDLMKVHRRSIEGPSKGY